MNLSKEILGAAGVLKPVLLKIFPYEFLKKIKGVMVKDSLNKIEGISIRPFERSERPDGINLIGNMKAETGLGQSCRLLADVLENCCVPYSIYEYDQLGATTAGNYNFSEKSRSDFPYNINLIHINPHDLGLAFMRLHDQAWDGHYNIGFWLWELEEFPEEWMPCFHCVDEIWTPSEFTSSSIRRKTSKPVITIPYHVKAEVSRKYERSEFGLPEDQFLFLMMYDRTSSTERKNPQAVLRAFREAFPEKENVGIVIKISNSTEKEVELIRQMLPTAANIYFITDILTRDQVNGLIQCADAVVSLHRSEGFGLVMAEAMLLGTPVIATNWSANSEFMTEDTSCLVKADMITLKEDVGAFKKGNRWADADIRQAAGYMRMLFEHPEYGKAMAERAKRHIESCLSMEQAVRLINGRIEAIYSGRERQDMKEN